MENCRRCEFCNVNVHRACMQKHLRSKKHLENMKQNDIILPEKLLAEEQAPIKNKINKIYKPKISKQIGRESIKMNVKN